MILADDISLLIHQLGSVFKQEVCYLCESVPDPSSGAQTGAHNEGMCYLGGGDREEEEGREGGRRSREFPCALLNFLSECLLSNEGWRVQFRNIPLFPLSSS